MVSFPQPHLSGGTVEPRGKCGTSEQDRGRRKKKEEEEEEGTLEALKRKHKDLSPADLGTPGPAHATDVWLQTFKRCFEVQPSHG